MNKVADALNNKNTIIISCDIKKAFDTYNHHILVKKRDKLGVHSTELSWFESYLTDRKQFVTVDDSAIELLSILTSVPRGFILVPLLFLIYINPNSHGVGHIGPSLFWRQIATKNIKCKNFYKYAKAGKLSCEFFFSEDVPFKT
jgi:hypothetical protein